MLTGGLAVALVSIQLTGVVGACGVALLLLAAPDLLRHLPTGALAAVVSAVIEFLWDGWRPRSAVLGQADGIQGYHDLKRYPDARLTPGLVRFRPCRTS